MSSPAGTYNIICDQGATLQRQITWKDSAGAPINLSTYSARMQVRPTTDSTTVTLELTTANGRLTLGGAAGTIDILVLASAMTMTGEFVYDLELVTGTTVTRLLQGYFNVRPEVTR